MIKNDIPLRPTATSLRHRIKGKKRERERFAQIRQQSHLRATRGVIVMMCHAYLRVVILTLTLIAFTALFAVLFPDSSSPPVRAASDNRGGVAAMDDKLITMRTNTSASYQPSFNASRDLDFAVIGFPKTGTTFLLEVLGRHPEITMPPKEFCQIHHETGDKELINWMKNTTAAKSSQRQKYGIKCPTMIRVTNAIENLMKVTDQARLVVGVRHPVLWFQSFYNYRVAENYLYPELYKDSPIPSPFGLNSTHHWRECSTAYAKYEIFLKQLAKVSLTADEMLQMLRSDRLWKKRFSVNPFKVFIYSSDQLQDTNTTRQSQFRHDLKEFLRLDTPLIDFNSVPKVNANTEYYPEYIDICQPKYARIKNALLKSGKETSEWILKKFIKSSDVVVSNREFFRANLRTWGVDPCKAYY
ncbi:hypothetical protein HJC23_003428 [Cyclotella cryptica]|uniref:Sulfotransferase domain-containing protein n=1 Tax=Cyclotella cryptica TaxID=29204 RepID=A0ABD3QS18_9STRA